MPPALGITKHFSHQCADLELVRTVGTLADLLQELGRRLQSDPLVCGCEVNLLNETDNCLVTAFLNLPAEFAGIQSTYQGFHYQLDHPDANAQVFASGLPVIIDEKDLEKFGETTRMRFERWKMKSLAVVPLMARARDGSMRTIGTVTAFSQEHALDQGFVDQAEALADLYAPQVLLQWTCHQAVERGKHVEVMYSEIQQFIAYITDMNSLTAVEEVYASIGREFIKRFKFDLVNILLAEGSELAMVHTSFSEPYRHLLPRWEPYRSSTRYSLSVRDGQSALIYSNNQRFLVPDCMSVLHLPMAEKDRIGLEILKTPRSFLIVPIQLKGQAIGVLWLVTLAEPARLSEADLTLIEMLAAFIGTAIRNAQAHTLVEAQNREIDALNKALQDKLALLDQIARMDRLTGLHNFGSFEEELKRRTSGRRRGGNDDALSLILLDIDHFKPFNDTYGHPAGNQVLQQIGTRIMASVRDMDFVARYGGEEFVVLLPQCELDGAERFAERIRYKIAEEVFLVDGREHSLTISGGCAQLQPQENDKSLISRADTALYAAKRNGRNRIEKAKSR